MLLDNGKFLTELHKLYDSNKAKGSVWVTLKRSECTGEARCHFSGPSSVADPHPACSCPQASLHALPTPPVMAAANMKPRRGKKDYSGLEYLCLVRATDGRRKLTTQVQGKDLAKFQDSYTTIQRVGGRGGG